MTTTSAAPAAGTTDEEWAARRDRSGRSLLRSATTATYDPVVDIDWDAPLEPDLFYVPEHRSSLYGTPLWRA